MLQPSQLDWCRQHLIKDGVPIFKLFETTPVIRLDEQTRKQIEDSRK